jgi:hypothetical protein
MSLLSLANDIKPWLGIDAGNTNHDSVLQVINLAIEQAVLNYVETNFALTTVTNEIVDGNISDIILVENVPLVSVTSLYFNCGADGTGGDLIDPSSYKVRSEGIYLRSLTTPRGRAIIKVSYTYGYNGLPSDVKLMMLQSVEAEWRRKGNKSLGLGGRSKKDESESFINDLSQWDGKTGLPVVLVSKLQAYKNFSFPVMPIAQRNW